MASRRSRALLLNGRRGRPRKSRETTRYAMLLLRDGTRTMTSRTSAATTLRQDLLLALFLVVLCVVMRLLPHASNFSPVAAAALFAGVTLKARWLAIAVPLVAMLLSDAVLGGYGWTMM